MLLTLCESEPHRLADIFAPGLPLVQLLQYQLEQLVARLLPKLSAHFTAHGITPTMFSAQWLLTIFTYSFSFSVTCRIWDSFLLEGWKVVFRFSIAVLAHHEATLLQCDMEGILTFMHVIHEGLEADALVQAAFRVKLKRKQLLELRQKFEAEHGPIVSPVKRMQSFSARKAHVQQQLLAGPSGGSRGGGGAAGHDSEGGQHMDAFSSASSDGSRSGTTVSDVNGSAGAFQGAHGAVDADADLRRAGGGSGGASSHDPGHAPSRKNSNMEDLHAVLVPGSPAVAEHTARARRASANARGGVGGAATAPPLSLGAGCVGDDAPSPRRRASGRSLLVRSASTSLAGGT